MQNETSDIHHRTDCRCFVGLMNKLSARTLTDAKCGMKHLTTFPLELALEPLETLVY